jgi:glutaminyl-tRNA synthetase
LPQVFIEPALGKAGLGEPYQFLRKGYFCLDESSKEGQLVFNRTVSLRDTWAKEVKKETPVKEEKKMETLAGKGENTRKNQ